MRALAVLQVDMGHGDQGAGTSVHSNYTATNLDNKLLYQTLSLLPQPLAMPSQGPMPSSCPSLQPSSLSSTTSSLLSSSSSSSFSSTYPRTLTSSLLSTENTLLKRAKLSSLSTCLPTSCSPVARLSSSLVPSSNTPGGLCSYRPSCPHPGPYGEAQSDGGEETDAGEAMSQDIPSYSKQRSMNSDQDGVTHKKDLGVALELPTVDMELPTVDMELDGQELRQSTVISPEEFAEFERGKGEVKEELKNKKYLLLNEVCCSLVHKSAVPGQTGWEEEESVWARLKNLAVDISVNDPQFLLKVAVYTRQELNIRITANFLLALAANLTATKPHVRRYFCASIQLPSDWLEVVRIYSLCFSRSLPNCLKRALADKFKQFSEYQLAKYNTRKHRCKHNNTRPKAKSPTDQQLEKWANMLRSDATMLKKFLKVEERVAVDKKQSEFSLKKMIKLLHIKEPAQHVMAILGKKYPGDRKAFSLSGLSGEWERERAGQRMKLKQPETWERKLSQEGNKALTWEKLIDSHSLPFMAMLRNLRNMITQGVSEKHHQKILARLTNKKAVIQSRQFPFRFLAAYKVIMELNHIAQTSAKSLPSSLDILKGILNKVPKKTCCCHLDQETAGRKKMRVALGVPFIYRLFRMKKRALQKASQTQYTSALLARYMLALETAVQISCRYNVPPLPGRTAVFFAGDMMPSEAWSRGQDFCCPSGPEDQEVGGDEEEEEEETNKEGEDNLTPSIQEAAVLLSLMIGYSAEEAQLLFFDSNGYDVAQLRSDVLLQNVKPVMTQLKEAEENDDLLQKYSSLMSDVLTKKNKVNSIIVVAERNIDSKLETIIDNYRKDVNNDALLVKICLNSKSRHSSPSSDRNCVELHGFSEQILRFVAERGSSRLLDHVEHIDKLHHIPSPAGAADPPSSAPITTLPPVPSLRWRSVRVFVSSTFRDMHAERDILVHSVFPELRRRLAPHGLYLQEVELRWGVTEEESGRALELCLSEVCRSQMLIGILGERYGVVPPHPTLPDLPKYSWLKSAPAGLSITEMEIRQFMALHPDTAHQRMFCYYRTPLLSSSVPVAWRSHFAPESKEAESKMANLKRTILESDVKVKENYPCEWAGVLDGRPYVKGLEEFSKAVMENLLTAVMNHYVQESEDAELRSDVREQEVLQGALQRQFHGRAKQLAEAVGKARECQLKGGLLVVEGAPGHGKTCFMAALGNALQAPDRSQKTPASDVIFYSTAASQSALSVEHLLICLIHWLRKGRDMEEGSCLSKSYKDLLTEFYAKLMDTKRDRPLALLVDGADLLQDSRGQFTSHWVPQQPPKGVCLVVSATSNSTLLETLTKNKGAVLFPLGQLPVPDRKQIVQKQLDDFGKRLSDSAFNNQLQTLLMKKGAVSPLYLHLACEELRNFGSFEKLKESVQSLPQSLSQLVRHSLTRLQSQHREIDGLRWALAALTVSTSGLRERDLYAILNMCASTFSKNQDVPWQEVCHLARRPKGRVPMATFTHMVRSLQSLIGPSHSRDTDNLLALTNPEVKRAFEEHFLSNETDRIKAHQLLAAHLWVLADPQGTDTFLHCEADSILHLPVHLIKGDQREELCSLLSSYYFLFANVRHGLLHHLLEIHSLTDQWDSSTRDFLLRHAPLLSSYPALFIQQALNEPPHTPAHHWAQSLMGNVGGVRAVRWLNNIEGRFGKQLSELVSTFSSQPTCLALNPEGQMMAVGTEQGTLHFIHAFTRQEVRSLVSSCDGISDCLFLSEQLLCTTSFDGHIEMWDVESGCRTASIDGHSNQITDSCVTTDKKNLATVSLDFTIKIWSCPKGSLVVTLSSPSPLNCVTFDPEGRLVAAGSWDGKIRVWNWLQGQAVTTLTGHQKSVRSLSFSKTSSMLCSGCLDGEVRLWSVPTSTCVGHYQAHFGATQVLTFLPQENLLLSAGSDHMLQLWCGSLGHLVVAFRQEDECDASLCVAVTGNCAAVGYHGSGLKLFSPDSGEKTWASKDWRVSVLCLLWLVPATEGGPEFLVSGGGDKRLRLWRKEDEEEDERESLVPVGDFGVQQGPILALAQNNSYLASASDDFTVALWLIDELRPDPWAAPSVVTVLRGHTGGVTCLAFSPSGQELLSGAKDKALMVWDVSCSSSALSKSFPHAHKDWITGCAWTPECVVSCSSDCSLCVWDLQTGDCVKEICWKSPFRSLCCLGELVLAGCADGDLHVWKWATGTEINHIAAHSASISHCSVLPHSDTSKEALHENVVVATASDNGSVKLWKPFQCSHLATLQGHSGGIRAAIEVPGEAPHTLSYLTVSEDMSLRSWWSHGQKGCPPGLRVLVTAVCYSPDGDVLLCGYGSGLVEVWQNNAVAGHKQASDSTITAICSMPGGCFAVGCRHPSVTVWKLAWNPPHCTAKLVKVVTHTVDCSVTHLNYCSTLLATFEDSTIAIVGGDPDYVYYSTLNDWDNARILGLLGNDEKSVWLLAEQNGELCLGFTFAMGPKTNLSSTFGSMALEMDQKEGEGAWITAATVDKDFVVCGDAKGNMWFNQPPDLTSWSSRKPAHSSRISVLKVTSSTIVSGSHDRTIKLWDRNSKKQVGMFVCEGPVLTLEVNPQQPSELVCGDGLGMLYFLSWCQSS